MNIVIDQKMQAAFFLNIKYDKKPLYFLRDLVMIKIYSKTRPYEANRYEKLSRITLDKESKIKSL